MFALISGLIAAFVHVLAGPDHLVAVAPLAVRGHRRAWIFGLRWGVGHSAGVLLIGLLAVALKNALPLERISAVSERLVGVLLIGIGIWSVRQALQVEVHSHEHSHDGSRHGHVHLHGPGHGHGQEPAASGHSHGHAALGIGTLHGLAGSSHFLGVLPSLAFQQRWESALYLAGFAVGTIIAMAGFSFLIGAVAGRWAAETRRLYRGLMWTCSAAAFAVGGWWLIVGGA